MNRYFGLNTLEGELHALIPRYLMLAPLAEECRLLDIGCGTGVGASLLADLGARHIDAIDHRPEIIEFARSNHSRDRICFQNMFWEELDFESNTFDIALCLDEDAPGTDPHLLQEVSRVLKPEGEYVCTLLRRNLTGLEDILPRYGYETSGETVSVAESETQPPQIGPLKQNFESIERIIQRPRISYDFDHLGYIDSEDGEQPQNPSQQEPSEANRALCPHRDEVAKVELLRCANGPDKKTASSSIHLPYYSLMERLRILLDELQTHQSTESQPTTLDEIVDPRDAESDREDERAQKSENEPNPMHANPLAGSEPLESIDELEIAPLAERIEARLEDFEAQHSELKSEFKQLYEDARLALRERDRYIDHLVDLVQQWRDRLRAVQSASETDATEAIDEIDSISEDWNDLDEIPENVDPEELENTLQQRLSQLENETRKVRSRLSILERLNSKQTEASSKSIDESPQNQRSDSQKQD